MVTDNYNNTPLPLISKVLSVDAKRLHENNGLTSAGDFQLYLEPKYADEVEIAGALVPLRRLGNNRRSKQAQAIFIILHETCHAVEQNGKLYDPVSSEIAANKYAAKHFKSFCQELGYDLKTTTILWSALPDYWRKPDHIANR